MAKLDPIQVRYVNIHRSAIRALLALEARAKTALAASLRREVAVAREDVLAAIGDAGDSRAKAASAIAAARRAAGAMAMSVARDVLQVRDDARAVADGQFAKQMQLVVRLAKLDGYAVSAAAEQRLGQKFNPHAIVIGGVGDTRRIHDLASAELAGRAAGDKFLRATMGNALDWQSTGLVSADLTKWIQETREQVLKQAAEMAARNAVPAYSDEIDQQIHEFFTSEFGEEEWTGNVFNVWSAAMDRATCPRCANKDGTIQPASKPFDPAPGLVHPHCRCESITLYAPNAIRGKLPGLMSDYRSFKPDLGHDEEYPVGRYFAEALQATSFEGKTIKGGSAKASTSEYTARRMLEASMRD
jgi:hypothetical protein